jgi:two-component system phosphate regulon response regulator PhoB/two-component system alkaline phosphatase synthesis response regulator PhoP
MQQPSVLVIEDDPWLAEVYAHVLSKELNVNVAATIPEAIESIEAEEPDVIVLDLMLSEYGGVEFLHELRVDPDLSEIPIVVSSAVNPARCRLTPQQWEQYGVMDYLYKVESSPQELLATIERVITQL